MLKIRGNKKEILKAMQDANRAVPTKTTMEILTFLLLEANDGELRIRGTNLDTTIDIAVDVTVEEGGAIAINAKNTIEFISKIDSEEISIEQKENDVIAIYYDMSEANLKGMNGEQFPNMPIVEKENEIKMNAVMLKEMIEKTTKACSTEETRPILMGVLFDINNDNLTLVSLDGYRLMKSTKVIEGIKENKKIVVPGKALQNITKLIGNDKDAEIEINYCSNHVEFNYMGTKIISRLLEGEYVNYNQIIPEKKDQPIKIKINAQKLKETVERVSLLSEEKGTKLIDLQTKDNKMIITGGSAFGTAQEELQFEGEGEIDITFNSKFVTDALDSYVGDCVLHMKTNTSPVIITEDGVEETTALILPVRKKAVTATAA